MCWSDNIYLGFLDKANLMNKYANNWVCLLFCPGWSLVESKNKIPYSASPALEAHFAIRWYHSNFCCQSPTNIKLSSEWYWALKLKIYAGFNYNCNWVELTQQTNKQTIYEEFQENAILFIGGNALWKYMPAMQCEKKRYECYNTPMVSIPVFHFQHYFHMTERTYIPRRHCWSRSRNVTELSATVLRIVQICYD